MRVVIRVLLSIWLIIMAVAGHAAYFNVTTGLSLSASAAVGLMITTSILLWLFAELLSYMRNR